MKKTTTADPPPPFTAEELARLFSHVPAVVWACDEDLRFTFVAGSALGKLGFNPRGMIGMPIHECFGNVRRTLDGETVVSQTRCANVVLECRAVPLRGRDGTIRGAIGAALDVTQRKEIEDELIVNRYRVAHASALFPVGHFVADDFQNIAVNAFHRRMFGWPDSVSKVSLDQVMSQVHPEDRWDLEKAGQAARETGEVRSSAYRVVRTDGSICHVRQQTSYEFNEDGSIKRAIGTITDVTEEVERQQLAELLQHDGITGLCNRACFTERLLYDLEYARESSEVIALVLFDLDRFSRINDALGHVAGDAYLRTIASRMRSFQTNPQDLIGRIGADEFAILLRGAKSSSELMQRVDALRRLVEEEALVDETPLTIGISMGVAIYPYDASDASLMQKADLALSHARTHGMGRTQYYDELLGESAASSLRLERGLHAAVRGAQIVPYYQVIVDAEHRISGIEALARWEHPDHGVLEPPSFLDIAEESGLIVEMGESVLLRAFQDAVYMRKQSPTMRLNVNLSSRHLLSRNLLDFLRDAFERSGLPPDALQIEVTEQSLIEDVSAGRKVIDSLRALGASVVIDDFGTGYNTLTYVKSYHVDGIKLDRVFTKDMVFDRYSRAVCEGVMAMANSLRFHVIAEGIETTEQRDAAVAMGCSELQGFLFGEPMPLRAMKDLLRAS